MIAMRAISPGSPLLLSEEAIPRPGPGQVLIQVRACGVCRTDLHIADGEVAGCAYPVIPGHEIVGVVSARGDSAGRFQVGDRVGVPWLGSSCGACEYCVSGRENLCDRARFTGCSIDGGFAEYAVADERFCVRIPEYYDDLHAAPLLCAGLIGFRAYSMAGNPTTLGLYGFGAAAHILAQVGRADGRRIFAFTRPGDVRAQAFARTLGAEWAGGSDESPPEPLDAAILFAPVGALVPQALGTVKKGGCVVCAGIHMSEIPAFPYSLLWGERRIQSVANLTRTDAANFMEVAGRTSIKPQLSIFNLREAGQALSDLRSGAFEGAAVLVP